MADVTIIIAGNGGEESPLVSSKPALPEDIDPTFMATLHEPQTIVLPPEPVLSKSPTVGRTAVMLVEGEFTEVSPACIKFAINKVYSHKLDVEQAFADLANDAAADL